VRAPAGCQNRFGIDPIEGRVPFVNPANLSKKDESRRFCLFGHRPTQNWGRYPGNDLRNAGFNGQVAIEEINGTKVLQVETWDLLPSNLFTHSVLNVVYLTYLEIEREYGSILNLQPDVIIRKLIERSLAPQTARQCVDFLNEIDWRQTQLPLRQWLKHIRNFYYGKP
jgi:hypothetical protein